MNHFERNEAQEINGREDAEGETPMLLDALQSYLDSCHSVQEPNKKKASVFPNLAGFCRRLGEGLGWIESLRHSQPTLYDRICTVLEDEALNAELSPTVLTAYLKKRLGYGEKSEATTSAECGQLRLVFEHDILEDGV
ncbi:MAG: hypothetical protein IKC31_05330 [Clostridia bacterium]|nr:hypothetical protein [Clostridia bacterium]